MSTDTLSPSGCVDLAHRLLLWADCLVPDDVVVAARAWLADGLTEDVTSAVAFAVLSEGLTVPDRFAGLLAGALRRGGAASDAVLADPTGTLPDVTYAPVDADGPATALDLTADPTADPVDRAATQMAEVLPDATAVWRSWRRPPAQVWSPGGGTRGHLFRLADPPAGVDASVAAERLTAVAGWLQANLPGPVRVYRHERELPIHLRMALDHAALLWTRPVAGSTTAPPRLDAQGPDAVAPTDVHRAYLRAGTPVLIDLAHDGARPDLDDPPMVRTDGVWLWRDTADRIGPGLAAHIDGRATPPGPVDETTLRRAVIVLTDTDRATD